MSRDVHISKALSYLLRHGAIKEGLPIDDEGWVPVSALLAHNRLKGLHASADDIRLVVADNAKQRFSLREAPELAVCANQGHTIAVTPALVKLDAATMPQNVYHGTYAGRLAAIEERGLSRMARNHIHLTSDAEWSVLGIRASCTVLIYIDTARAMAAGLEFWRSANGVILCAGDANGTIPCEFFRAVEHVQPTGGKPAAQRGTKLDAGCGARASAGLN